MKSIYKSAKSKRKVMTLYDKQLRALKIPYKDLYIKTTFGMTHIVETGNHKAAPLLALHGGNTTTAYNLMSLGFLQKDFHIYAVDTMGHPGKSEDKNLSPFNYDYGTWVSELIDGLGYEKMNAIGGSFGGGILVKAMCAAPEKFDRIVLYVPAAIKNANVIKDIRMLFPLAMYHLTHKEFWLIKSLLPMAITKEALSKDLIATAKCSIDNVKIKKCMPTNVDAKLLSKCKANVFLLAAEKDCLFPGKGVIKRAEKMLENCTTYLLPGRGHINKLSPEEINSIKEFLLAR